MNEEKLNKEFEVYRELAKQNKKIDVASLMINALQKQDSNSLSDKQKRWAYLISLGLPPFGLLFAAKFYYSGKDDGEHAAWICTVLTAVSVLLFVVLAKVIFSTSGLNLKQITPDLIPQAQQLYQ
jgi:hypothetical protein